MTQSLSPIVGCRVCGRPLFEEPLFRFEGMPSVAQHFPDDADLAGDHGTDFDVEQCTGCGLVQLTCEPVPYFRDVIRAAAVSPEMAEYRGHQFSRFVEKFGLTGQRIVEVGCGEGEYLQWLSRTGAVASGLEHGARAVEACRRKGLHVLRGFADSTLGEIPGAPYSGFLMLSCLEHLPDVNGTLGCVHRSLAREAVGLVEVPNFDMLLRERSVVEFMTDHLLYFTGQTLETTLQANGFEVLDCRATWHDYILSATVRKRSPHDVRGFHRVTAAVKRDVDDFLGRLPGRSVAIWGAGHQALAAIVLHELADRVAYVVDSAEFKQGRFTPGTHLPVRSPEQLKADPAIRGVIVIGGGYSDEIALTLKREFPQSLSLAILRPAALELVSGP